MFKQEVLKHVDYLWDNEKASKLEGDEVALLLYRSNILGTDLRITNYGGGNTSCKTVEKDPLTGEKVDVMWIKGSGGDIGTLKKEGLAGLYLRRLHDLKKRYNGLEYEDEMVELYQHCIYDLDSRAPSIDTALHAFLPFKHIDHLHPDAVIAVAAAKDGKTITKEIYGDSIAWLDWQRPGFDLGLKLEKCLNENPGIRGIMLGSHGLFTWGDSSYDCYINSLEVINKAAEYIASKEKNPFGGEVKKSLDKYKRMEQAAGIMPVLRGLCSSEARMIGHFTDSDKVLEFVNSKDLHRLAAMGTSCPDHFLRTKIQPLVLDVDAQIDVTRSEEIKGMLEQAFIEYRKNYEKYYHDHKHADSPPMRDPNPVIILWPGVGMFSFAKNKQTARVASEFYVNAINVMRGSEAISSYTSLPWQEAFNIEYWALEEAKLKRMPPEKPLSRKIAIISGGAGGIGKAIAKKLIAEGACVVVTDLDENPEMESFNIKDTASYLPMDVTRELSIEKAFKKACLDFGGVDIVINSAGLAISKSLADTSEEEYDLLMSVLAKGQFKMCQIAAEYMKKQGLGGDIINIASKNALVSGPNNVAYGTAKAAQTHMSRLLAAELGPEKIRVNTVNPDAVIEGSRIWEGKWAEGRAKAYGISVEDLPKHYAKRTLLNEVISTDDIANAVFAFVSGLLSKSTGNILNVDGGVPAAFVR